MWVEFEKQDFQARFLIIKNISLTSFFNFI